MTQPQERSVTPSTSRILWTAQIAINQFSAEVVGENGAPLGNVSILPVSIAAGASGIIDVTGNLSQSAINQLEAEYQSGSLNISLKT